ncbi:hypothetical protein [Mobilicoccus pelagius]|uniref:Uncharacterized protein n=1 Tax=Mobilicoccus pelagius NBRC 104925 TaxID=1089455 RepID=H5UV72_9MICO|nr:hypothetical protein [Mobilicoccus pelagius]GAB49630.1 hypothetical protein MOPEL_130_02370 [Mobilicoccus pelagius NBRC 104925]
MSDPTPRPAPAPGPRPAAPVPAPPGTAGGRELQDSLGRLTGTDPGDLDAVVAAAEETHQHLRNRLGHAGGR